MAGISIFGDMVQSITDRGRRLLSVSTGAAPAKVETRIESLCDMLLSSRGEASGMALAAEVLDRWTGLEPAGQYEFMMMLADRFGPDLQRVQAAVAAYRERPEMQRLTELHQAAEPRRQELLRRLNLAPHGTARLVAMRAQLLAMEPQNDGLRAVDADFLHLFGSWFNRGFLTLRPIDWSTPATILEKIIRYEAVHEIAGWDELRRRLAPPDRRCFAFFHPRLADDPLIFVEVALTTSVPFAIDDVLAEDRAVIAPETATTAVFYSISNCQDGLRGVFFGNFLIKQVVEDLRRDLPGLKTFVTLSPVPGFAAWIERLRAGDDPDLSAAMRAELTLLDDPDWIETPQTRHRLEVVLTRLAARYLVIERGRGGRPLDPVARFHLGNGARLERLNLFADRSARSLSQSHGLMVNYLYDLEDIEANHEALAQNGHVTAAPAIRDMARMTIRGKRQ